MKSSMIVSSQRSICCLLLLVVICMLTTSSLCANQQVLKASLENLPSHIRLKILSNQKRFIKLVRQISKQKQIADLMLLVDKKNPLPDEYAPKELTNLSEKDWGNTTRANIFVSSQIIPDLKKMLEAAAKEGVSLQIGSGYRDYVYQKKLFDYWSKQLGAEKAKRLSAVAGTSQHQLGTVVDFYPISTAFDNTQGQKWLQVNASKYGFSLSYPQGHEKQTGYIYESWHYRYIGPVASQIQDEFFEGLQYLFLSWYAKYHAAFR